jgi:hypothetical protein
MVQLTVLVSISGPLEVGGSRRCFPLAALAQDDLLRTHSREELTHTDSQSFLNERVVDPIGVSALEDQACILEDAEVPRDRRSADRKARADLAGCQFTGLEILENLSPGRVSKSAKYAGVIIHGSILAN